MAAQRKVADADAGPPDQRDLASGQHEQEEGREDAGTGVLLGSCRRVVASSWAWC